MIPAGAALVREWDAMGTEGKEGGILFSSIPVVVP